MTKLLYKLKGLLYKNLPLIILLILVLAFHIKHFQTVLNSAEAYPGYFDIEERMQTVEGILHSKIIYKDFWISKGYLQHLLMIPAYILFGQTYYALYVSLYIVLPTLSFLLLYYLCTMLYENKIPRYSALIIVYIHTIALQSYVSIRFIYPVFALVLLNSILTLFKNRAKLLLYVSGIIVGLSFLMSIEYGITILLITPVSLILYALFEKKLKLTISKIVPVLLGLITPVLVYASYLYYNNVFGIFYKTTFSGIKGFQYNNPCNDVFPKFWEMQTYTFFDVTHTLLYYLPLILYMFIGFYILYFLYKKKTLPTNGFLFISLLLYGLLSYKRTLIAPCDGYHMYSIPPLITLVFLWVQEQKQYVSKRVLSLIMLFGILLFFILLPFNNYTGVLKVINTINKENVVNEYYAPFGYSINPLLKTQYEEIVSYIQSHTNSQDSIFVYPTGIYNKVAGRNKAAAINSIFMFQGNPLIVDYTVGQLKKNDPKYVLLNTYNNLALVVLGTKRLDAPLSYFCLDIYSPCFSGEGGKIEQWIVANYELEKSWDIAAVLKKRDTAIKYEEELIETPFLFTDSVSNFSIFTYGLQSTSTGSYNYTPYSNNPSILVTFNTPEKASIIDVFVGLKTNIVNKQLSIFKYEITVNYFDNGNLVFAKYPFNAYGVNQRLRIGFPGGYEKSIDSVRIALSKNLGFSSHMPSELILHDLKLYTQR